MSENKIVEKRKQEIILAIIDELAAITNIGLLDYLYHFIISAKKRWDV